MAPAAAFAALGLAIGASPAEVRAAYVAAGRSAHPDAGGTIEAFVALREAYDAALAYAIEEPCPACSGRGNVFHRVGWSGITMMCVMCSGSGRRHN